ncbi:MAG: type II toxin-antitoxin system Phd/YefM family antitoxin [Chloroflexi bacterium]|nr:type II toxin-antitoxin system Phd/YefM family antitoxin [Chloroflexota bacterium]
MTWQVQEAKQRLSEVIQRSLEEGPQVITRRGQEVAVVIAADEYERLTGRTQDFKAFLLSAPDLDALDIVRDRTPARRIEL